MIDLDHAERQFRHPASASGNNELGLELIAELRALRDAALDHESIAGSSSFVGATGEALRTRLIETVGEAIPVGTAATLAPPSEPSAAPLDAPAARRPELRQRAHRPQ